MNPSTALATVLVDELVRGGVREAVLCPGSRNAPLSFALHDADRDGRLRLHVRIDERTAGFLALGLAKASGLPVPVVTTSGTAAVNLHPAVVEADYSRVRLVVLTADRPVEMRGTGANQTIDQVNLYGGSVRWFHELSADERDGGGRLARRGGPRARRGARPGRCTSTWRCASRWCRTGTRPGRSRWTPRSTALDRGGHRDWGYSDLVAGGRTVVVAGDQALADARGLAEARRLAAARGAVVRRTGPGRTRWLPTGCCSATSVTASSGWSWPAGRPCPGR